MDTIRDRLQGLVSNIRDFWTRLTINQKVLIGGAALLVVIAVIVLARGSRQPEYEVLYSELSEKDAADVVAKLDEFKVPYELSDNGTTILVNKEDKYKTRLKLAGENLPRGESGFELFEDSNFGETQTDKQVKYQVALQGELARTIQSLEKVKSARVHIVMPEETLFSEEEQKPTAAVAVTTKDDQKLTSKEVEGITNLVANSIKGMKPEEVVIIDQHGRVLSDEENYLDAEQAPNVANQMAMKRRFEKEKEQVIQSMLDKTLGKDNAVVRVSAELNFDAREEKEEEYWHDPEGPFVRSESVKKETGEDVSRPDANVPGTDTNIPEYTEVEDEEATSTYDKKDTTRNYEINKREAVTRYASGDTEYDYLTVSVLVNRAAVSKLNIGNSQAERIDTIRRIVATAVGLRENRENEDVDLEENISVAFIDFYSEPVPEPDSALAAFMKTPLGKAILALVIIVAVMAAVLISRRRMEEERLAAELAEQQEFEAVVDDELRVEDLLDKDLTPEERENQRLKQEVEKMIDKNPEDAAQIIRTWLMEDQR